MVFFAIQQLKFSHQRASNINSLLWLLLARGFGDISVRMYFSFFISIQKTPAMIYFGSSRRKDSQAGDMCAAARLWFHASRSEAAGKQVQLGNSLCFLCSIWEYLTLVCNLRLFQSSVWVWGLGAFKVLRSIWCIKWFTATLQTADLTIRVSQHWA